MPRSEKKEYSKNPEFLSTVSHELRAPLATVREGLSQMAGGFLGALNHRQKTMMRLVLDEVDRLYRIVNGLLDISRMEAGKTVFHKVLFDLSDLVRRHTKRFQPLTNKKNISLKLSLPKGPVEVFADPAKITQVLTNLISNAYKFTPAGGRIHVEVQKGRSEITVSVSDTGVGIGPDDVPRLFNKFSQFSPAVHKDIKGTGLGLAISKGLIELHRGRIWAESRVGRGSRFIFTLPVMSNAEISKECVEAGISEAAYRKSPMLLFMIRLENDKQLQECMKKVDFRTLIKELESHLSGILKENAGAFFNEKFEYILMMPGADREIAKDYERKFKFLISGFVEQVRKKYKADIKVKLGLSIYPEEGDTSEKLLLKARIAVRELILSEDHRRKPRGDFQFNINFTETDGAASGLQTVDISEGGLCLNSHQNLTVGSKQTIALQLPDGHGKLEAKTVVRWVEKIGGTAMYKMGLQFYDISPSSKKALKDFLNQRIFHGKS